VQVDDLVQNGMLGLLDAIGRFEEGLGAQFETYAVQRIRGAMLDGLRENDWLPRSLRRDMRRIEAPSASSNSATAASRPKRSWPSRWDMALADYQKMLQDARGTSWSTSRTSSARTTRTFLERHLVEQRRRSARALLDKNMRDVLVRKPSRTCPSARSCDGAVLRAGSQPARDRRVMGVTESRVCQLHSQAVARLRARLVGEEMQAEAEAKPESHG
jgi:RNA polymerase sigma factor for flagellar operon FliA